jgi:hypothetical protein
VTDETTAQSKAPESPLHSRESNPPPATSSVRGAWAARAAAEPSAATRPKRSRRKKILVPTVLAVIGAAMIVAGLWLYPRRPEVSAPAAPTVQIDGSSPYVNDHMEIIFYTVSQVRPGVARVEVEVQLRGPPYVNGGYTRVPHGAYAIISFLAGTKILDCSPGCPAGGTFGMAYPQFRRGPPIASASFDVRARSYEVAANGATAAVGFPEVDYSGTRQAELNLEYQNFPTAGSYDWSSSPGETISKLLGLTWTETVSPTSGSLIFGVTSARVATGVNHAAQQRDSNLTLAVGVLFGVAGGALVAAVQEALHD